MVVLLVSTLMIGFLLLGRLFYKGVDMLAFFMVFSEALIFGGGLLLNWVADSDVSSWWADFSMRSDCRK